MKNIFKFLLFSLVIAGLWSCEKEENKVIFLGGSSPVLTTSTSGEVPMAMALKENEAVLLKWTNPNYKFNTGVSSQDVNYTLQLDVKGAGFSSTDIQEKSLAGDLSYSLTVGELNIMMANLGLEENISHDLEVRLKSSLSGGSGVLYSNTVSFSAIPYLDVAVPLPASDNLYIIGNATPGGDATGWNNPVPVPNQMFTKTSSTTYEITIDLIGEKEYLIIPVNGSWDTKYAVKNNPAVAGLNEGGNFGFNFSDNFPGPAVSGTYKIELFFKTGKFKVTKL